MVIAFYSMSPLCTFLLPRLCCLQHLYPRYLTLLFLYLSIHPCEQPIDYEGFQLFMTTYLENDIPEELCQHLFTSFKSKTGGCSPEVPRAGAGLLGE